MSKDIFTTDMKVDGVLVRAKTQAVAFHNLRQHSRPDSGTLERILRQLGCGDEAYRAADRMMQKARKAGALVYVSRKVGWKWPGVAQ